MTQKKVTLKEIAQSTGVSLGTVHRAIYGKGGISEETRQRILEEVRRTNYQVDEAASVLKRGAKKVVVVLPKAQKEDRFYFRGLWRGIRKAAQGMEQYKIYFHFIESDYPLTQIWRELEWVYDEMLEEIDGLITVADSERTNVWISRFDKRGIPIILLSSYYPEKGAAVSCIKVDHERSGRLAAEFMHYGLRQRDGKILMLCGYDQIYSNRVYAEHFEKEMQSLGHEILKVEGFGREDIEGECSRYLEEEQVQAIFASNARNTFSICQMLEERKMGKDILVVGTDVFEELQPYYEKGILNAVIFQYHWEQGVYAVNKIHEYLSRGIRNQEDKILPPVLLMKSNYEYFL
ncbi:MAG TPA: LacI family transcriptional regulator [Clostridiales bacterium]|nr:LacI family transcriptional regulator [Clostridiales bacterium]